MPTMADPRMNSDEGADELGAFGAFLRSQRELANMSLRQVAAIAKISNPYLSQIERGLHAPSVTVIRSLADALDLSVETLLAQAAGITPDGPADATTATATESAIRTDPRLTEDQKKALLSVYRTMTGGDTGPV
jgi:transcriptional regulator with XRE-family HTH domain